MYGSKNNLGQALASSDSEGDDASSNPSYGSSGGSPSAAGSRNGVWTLNSTETNRLLLFCDIVLAHVNYPNAFLDQPPPSNEGVEVEREETESTEDNKSSILKNDRAAESPLNSVGESARESNSSTESTTTEMEDDTVPADKETMEQVTCWCGKPFAGRPMIECDNCLVWLHMKCEKVRQNSIPKEFHCSRCRKEKKKRKKSKKRASSGKEDTSRKSTKRSSHESSKKSSAVSISSFAKSDASSRLAGTSSESSGPVHTSKESQDRPEENGSEKGDGHVAKYDDSTRAAKVNSNSIPVQNKKRKSLSPSQLSRPKKLKKLTKEERRKSSGSVAAPSSSVVVNNLSYLTSQLGLSYENGGGAEGGKSSSSHKVRNLSSVSGPQNQMPPVLPCYGSAGKNAELPASAPRLMSSMSESFGGGHAPQYADNCEGFSSLASIPVLKPEISTHPRNGIIAAGEPSAQVLNFANNAPSQENGEMDMGGSASLSACLSFVESSEPPTFQTPMLRPAQPVHQHYDNDYSMNSDSRNGLPKLEIELMKIWGMS